MKTILFVCVHNAGRSVMAEAFFNRPPRRPPNTRAISAGTEPGGSPHPEVVEAMREVGIDVSAHRGTLLTDLMVTNAERVITMGCAVDSEACPAIRYADVEDWGLPDPKGQPIERVREIRDEVRARVDALRDALG
jgi:arsenate reductase